MLLFVYQILFAVDFLLLPFFLVVWIGIFTAIRNAKYKNTIIQKYFLPGLLARLAGAILTALMYQYYYGYGDTFLYYIGAQGLTTNLIFDPPTAIEMLFLDITDWDIETRLELNYSGFWYKPNEAIICRLAGCFGVLGLGTFIGTSLAITAFSFLGCWCLYLVFYNLYPHLHKELAYAILFLPSMCFWSTGIMKDPFVVAGLGFFVYGFYFLVMRPNGKIARNLILIYLGFYLMRNIKAYVVVSILPAIVFWFFLMFQNRIQNQMIRRVAIPFFVVFGGLGGFLMIQQLSSSFAAVASLDSFLHEAEKMQWWLSLSTERDGGTGYSLNFSPTVGGLIQVFPQAVNVALFRPYLWEVRKVIVMPSAIEAIFTFGFTLYVVYKTGFRMLLRNIIGEPTVAFCLVFSIIFAFAVGFTSMNFGALARYKIPCLPFYFVAMIILLDKSREFAMQSNVDSKEDHEIDSKTNPRLV